MQIKLARLQFQLMFSTKEGWGEETLFYVRLISGKLSGTCVVEAHRTLDELPDGYNRGRNSDVWSVNTSSMYGIRVPVRTLQKGIRPVMVNLALEELRRESDLLYLHNHCWRALKPDKVMRVHL